MFNEVGVLLTCFKIRMSECLPFVIIQHLMFASLTSSSLPLEAIRYAWTSSLDSRLNYCHRWGVFSISYGGVRDVPNFEISRHPQMVFIYLLYCIVSCFVLLNVNTHSLLSQSYPPRWSLQSSMAFSDDRVREGVIHWVRFTWFSPMLIVDPLDPWLVPIFKWLLHIDI